MYTLLSNLVIDFQGDAIAESFKNDLVIQICECGNTVMFQTQDGRLFDIYKSKLIK